MTSFWYLSLVISFYLTSLVTAKRVLLRDITALTFARGQNTNSRRSNAIPQLKCIGGSAYREWDAYPSVAQCYNRGYDGQDVQWECRAELPKSVFLGRVRVSCEGYDYPDDPYILSGSCGLEYELEYTRKKHHNRSFFRHMLGISENIKYGAIFGLLGLAALIWYCCLSGSRDDGNEQHFVRQEDEPFAGASAPPFPAEDPPSYEEATRRGPAPPYDDTWVHRRAAPTAPPYDDTWAHRRAAPTAPPSYGWTNLPSGSSRNTDSWIPPRDFRSPRPSDGTPRKTEPVRTETSSSPWLIGGLLAGAGLLGGYLLRGAVSGGTTESAVHTEARNQSRLYPTLTDSGTEHSSNNSDDEHRHVSTSFGSTTRR